MCAYAGTCGYARNPSGSCTYAWEGHISSGQSLLARIRSHGQPTNLISHPSVQGCKQAARNSVGLGIHDIAEISSLLTEVPS